MRNEVAVTRFSFAKATENAGRVTLPTGTPDRLCGRAFLFVAAMVPGDIKVVKDVKDIKDLKDVKDFNGRSGGTWGQDKSEN